MDFYTVIISSLSDMALLYAQINILSVISGKQLIKHRLISTTILSLVISTFFQLIFFKTATSLQVFLTIIISIENCILVLYSLKTYKIRHILIALIIKFLCYVTSSGIYSVVPTAIKAQNILFYRSIILFIIRMCVFTFSLFLKPRQKNQISNDKTTVIPIQTYILIIIDLFIEDGLIEVINYKTLNSELKKQMIKVLLLILILCTSGIIISLVINVAYKRYYAMQSNILEGQVKNQLNHYKKMDKINSEIRQFRHDYTNHISCLLNIIKSKRYEEAENYIINMSGKMPSENIIFRTGNYVADAILTDKQDEAGSNINIQFEGCIPSEINSTDLCIILSNALDNAIEAVRNIPGENTVHVHGNYQQGYFVLIIKNPTVNTFSETNELPSTSKGDTVHHGFGLSNIKHTVEKYNGKMNISVIDNTFVLSVAFDPDTQMLYPKTETLS